MALVALPLGLMERQGQAQVPQATAAASTASAAVAPAPAEPVGFQGQGQAQARFGQQDAMADSGGSDSWIERYKPEANLFEAGLFVGPLFISDRNSFRGPTVRNAGGTSTVRPLSNFEQPSVEFGLRGGYYPLAFLGAELEGMVALAETETGQGATALAGRFHLVAQLPYWSIVPFVVAGAGFWGVFNDFSGDDSDPAFHFGGGAKINVSRSVALRVDVRDNLTNQRGNDSYPHHIEALAGANVVFGRSGEAARDSDRDGIADDDDQCPLEAGAAPSGCPIRDSDGDGLADPQDQCAMEAGPAPTGCPIRDTDQDGVIDGEDQCISEPGTPPTGCPDSDQDGFLDRDDKCPHVPGVAPEGCLVDSDGDGLLGADDRCPDQPETVNGFEDSDGCPDEVPAAVKSFMGVISGLEFETNQATIRASSVAAIDKAASVLNEYPSLRLEIIGHTDNRGSREHNLDLSLRRAEAVKASLIARGINSTRIFTKGEGPDAPLTTNDTALGRQKNRRIEFRIIQ